VVHHKTARALRKQEPDPATSDSEREPGPSAKSIKRKAQAARKKAAAAKAHLGEENTAKPKAEGKTKTQQRLDKEAEQFCLRYQFNTCVRGDSCSRKHDTMSETIKLDLIKRLAEKNKISAADYEHQMSVPSTFDPDNVRVCYAFRQNGSCAYGDKCNFDHESPKKTNMGRHKHPHSNTGIKAKLGDLVVLTQACPIPSLGHWARRMAGTRLTKIA
jgi:hypothetical protein